MANRGNDGQVAVLFFGACAELHRVESRKSHPALT